MSQTATNEKKIKNKIIITLSTLLLFIAGITYFVIIPTVLDIKKMGDDIDAQRIDLEKKYIKGQSLNKLSNNLKKISPRLEALDTLFISQNRALEFITTLEQTADENNISQNINLMADKPAKEKEYDKIPLSITATGDFQNILKYMAGLESLNYYININNLSIINSEKRDLEDLSKISIQIMANSYWR